MSDIATKLTYLNETKSQLKDMINYGLPTENQITNETTFRNYVKGIFEAFLESLRDSTTLYTNLPKISGNGTQITLNDTANAPMRITLKASELTQDATPTPSTPQDIHTISGDNSIVVEGKNLFDYTKHTALALNNEGMITTTKYYNVDDLVTYKLKPNTKYTFSFKNADMELTSNNFSMAINGSWAQTASGKYSVTTDSNGEFTCKMGASAYPNIGLASLYIQLEGTTATEYEPYVSQTAPINLPVENKFDGIFRQGSSGSTSEQKRVYSQNDIFVKKGETYTLSTNLDTSVFRYAINISSTPHPNYNQFYDSTWQTTNTFTFTASDDGYLGVPVSRINNENLTISDISSYYFQIEKGTKANSYTPYGTTPIEYCKIGNYEDEFILTSGKNLLKLDFSNDSTNVSGLTFNHTDSTFTLSGTATGTYKIFNLTNIPKIKTGEAYTLSANITGTNPRTQITIRFRNGTTNVSIITINTPSFYTSTQTLDLTGVDNATFTIEGLQNGQSYNLTCELQLEKGSTATSYEPYGTNQWYLKKNIGKVVLDGSESGWYSIQTATTPTNRTVTKINNLIKFPVTNYFSNYFIKGSQTSNRIALVTPDTIYLSLDDTLTTITSGDTDAQKLTKMKAWLNSNNTTLYYVLETPTYTQITGTLETQLNNIYEKLLSYKGTTNISQVNNDLPFVLGVSAIQDLE